ncbi:hypothetical protein BYT27DRAFT_7210196 [Phlegmacium glaucopus]|nr:hypothetical protein BYT27DRAFT_7210196 [Phlegmacium glaucopus]
MYQTQRSLKPISSVETLKASFQESPPKLTYTGATRGDVAPPEEQADNWDDDFEDGISFTKLQAPASDILPIVEDYSDLATEEDEQRLHEKVADFKMKNNIRRGLFHPDDIKTIGLSTTAPGPLSAPLPSLSRKPSRSSISPLGSLGPSASSHSHSRSGSLATPLGSAGSFGHAEAKKLQNQTGFGKYAEDDEEDYEDVFGKPNATYSATKYAVVE